MAFQKIAQVLISKPSAIMVAKKEEILGRMNKRRNLYGSCSYELLIRSWSSIWSSD